MFMDPATDVVLPFNWCACSVLLYLCVLVLAACAVGAIEEGRSLYWTPADKWLTGVIGDWCWGKEDRGGITNSFRGFANSLLMVTICGFILMRTPSETGEHFSEKVQAWRKSELL